MDRTRFSPLATFALAPAVFAVVVGGCSGKDSYAPGSPIGTFHVSGKLTKSSCGSVPDPWEFDVKLRRDGPTLYWVQGGAPIQGRFSAGRADLSAKEVHTLRPANAKQRLLACAVVRADVLDVDLTNGGDNPVRELGETRAFRGTLVYRYTPTDDSDCADQVSSSGGGFDSLPCEVRYDVNGALLPDAPADEPKK